ncbi:hypothetical protein VM1G_05459 [Cytospora mali]|uniref:Uncharacterized protein n=1 Tax=Cytospora mali TaxID=578113 RepID=A0A194VZW3_CYTMA|nr:hypothetical protein VM1G_05459 [Valsa mali]
MKEVMMDQTRADIEGGPGLFTLGLAVCIGIAVVGDYNTRAREGETRYDKWLAHLADGPMMEITFNTLKSRVESAKRHGLRNLKVKMSVVDPESLREDDSGFVWSERDIRQTKDTNALYITKVRELTRTSSGNATLMRVERHHVNDAKDMEILASKEMRILS